MKSAIHVFSQPNTIPSFISRASKEHGLNCTVLIAALLLVTATGYAGDGDNIKRLSRDRDLPLLEDSQNVEAKRFIIRLKQRHRAKPDRKPGGDRKSEAIARLKQEAQSNQEKVLQLLKKRDLSHKENRRSNRFNRSTMGALDGEQTRSFWLSNCIAVTATPAELQQITDHPDVAEVTENIILSIPTMDISESTDALGPDFSWNQRLISLDKIVATGLDGRNVRLGVIDTGINPQYPNLAGKIASWAEFDFLGNKIDSDPHDAHIQEHGTHVASILAGDTTGVAPGATLNVALALPNGYGSLEQLLAAMQWILNPDNDATTDDGAQIVNMSWGMWGTSAVLRQAIMNMVKAGVLPVCAIGNTGDITTITYSPGNVPEALGVGALDQNEKVAWFSSWGVVQWGDFAMVKPDISAPGLTVPGMDSLGNMVKLTGTSFAAPHVAGSGALLLQHTPELTLTELRAFLLFSAKEIKIPDYFRPYGKSRLDVAEAVKFLERYSLGFNSADVVIETVNPLDDPPLPIVYQYFSDGQGGFSEPVPFSPVRNLNTKILGLADVNGDGYSDLITKKTEALDTGEFKITYTVNPSRNTAGFALRSFTWYSFISPSQAPHEFIGFGDVNGDKKEDMILGQHTISSIYYHWQIFAVLADENPNPDDSPKLWSKLIKHKMYPLHFGLGDVNGDNRSDLIVGHRYKDSNSPIYYYSHLSDGIRFTSPYMLSRRISASFFGPLNLLAVKDVNGDGWADLIVGSNVAIPNMVTPVYVSISNGHGQFYTEKIWASLPLKNGGRVETAADINNDGLTDLIVRNSDMSLTLDLWISDGDDRFVKQSQWLKLGTIPQNNNTVFKGAANIGLGDWRR
jgi:subtilisin family serine protease